ncbi:MAG: hypothetical protein ACK5ZW_12445, partial [Betaproteobacteria bacterium]
LARIRFLQHRNDLGFSKSRLLHLNLLAIKTMPESSTFSWSGIQGSLRTLSARTRPANSLSRVVRRLEPRTTRGFALWAPD